jgi:disulfide bond formation protein DsbB
MAWAVALASVMVSLYFSEVKGYLPCNLCWYARILMYPLVIIIGIGIQRRERQWIASAMVLAAAGWILELYHSLLQWGVIPEPLLSCVAGVPCSTKYINYLGFITIPFLGWLAFTAIGLCIYMYRRSFAKA